MAKASLVSHKLLTTDNYALFEVSSLNRDIVRTKELEQSMRQHGFISAYPLHCYKGENGKLIIKAGHHRFHVAQKLGLPVWYVVSDDDATIAALEKASRPWKCNDFFMSRVREGDEACVKVYEYCKRTSITLGQALSMFSGQAAGSQNAGEKVRNGTFAIRDTQHADDVAHLVLAMRNAGVPHYAHKSLVAAISKLLNVPEFNIDVFVSRVNSHSAMLTKCQNIEQYLNVLEKVYNHSARNRVNLAFLADKIAKERQRTFKRQ